MDIRIISSHENAHKATGLAVVIDVVRAFTTASYILQNNATSIIVAGEVTDAHAIKKVHPEYILVGERMGVTLPGFNYGNSPSEIANVNFDGKTIVLTTTAGTQGIVKATRAKEIITGAFVNAGAVISYIKKKNPPVVSFICTDDRWTDSEDVLCAQFIQAKLEGTPVSYPLIREQLERHEATKLFLTSQRTPYARQDLDRCYALDTFDFLIMAKSIHGEIHLVKKNIN